jgi:hypothetical protein
MNANPRRKKPLLLGLTCFSITGLSLLSGCSSFESRWKAAGEAAPAASQSLQGRWTGSWVSEGTGHQGGLRCIVTHKDGDVYLADFHATFWKIFQFGYSIDLKATQATPTRYQFTGDSDLGWLAGGKYHYDGFADVPGDGKADSFTCTYKSSEDHGRFDMTRPSPPATAPATP